MQQLQQTTMISAGVNLQSLSVPSVPIFTLDDFLPEHTMDVGGHI